jgi:hypothetical protein
MLWRRTPMQAISPSMRRRSIRGIVVAAVALVVAFPAGCVQRRMTIRSNPPGALVYVDDYQIGTTPVSTDFVYYGTRKIRLVKDGYETLTVRQPVPLPWYQVFPIDFVTENLWPWEIRDERVIDLAMAPAGVTVPESVVARAEQVRAANLATLPAPAPRTPPPMAAPIPAAPLPPQQFLPPPPAPLPAPQQQLVLPPPMTAPPTFVPPSGGPSQPGGF